VPDIRTSARHLPPLGRPNLAMRARGFRHWPHNNRVLRSSVINDVGWQLVIDVSVQSIRNTPRNIHEE